MRIIQKLTGVSRWSKTLHAKMKFLDRQFNKLVQLVHGWNISWQLFVNWLDRESGFKNLSVGEEKNYLAIASPSSYHNFYKSSQNVFDRQPRLTTADYC